MAHADAARLPACAAIRRVAIYMLPPLNIAMPDTRYSRAIAYGVTRVVVTLPYAPLCPRRLLRCRRVVDNVLEQRATTLSLTPRHACDDTPAPRACTVAFTRLSADADHRLREQNIGRTAAARAPLRADAAFTRDYTYRCSRHVTALCLLRLHAYVRLRGALFCAAAR